MSLRKHHLISKEKIVFTRIITLFLVLIGQGSYSQEIKIYNVNCHIPENEYEVFSDYLRNQVSFFEDYFELPDTFQISAFFVGDDTKKQFVGDDAHGLFSYRFNRISVYKTYRYHEIFKHEFNHWIYSKFSKERERQLSEGIAELFEDSFYHGDTLLFGLDRNKVTAVQKHLNGKINLAIWLGQSNEEFYVFEKTKNYQIAWALMYYLYHQKPFIFKRIVFPNSNSKLDLVKRVESSYAGGISQLQEDLKSYYSDLNFELFERGRHFLQLEQNDSAIMFLRKAIAAHPNHAESHLYLGIALEEIAEVKESAEHFAKAFLMSPRLEKVINLRKAYLAMDRMNYDDCVERLMSQLPFANTDNEKYTVFNSLATAYTLSFRPIQSLKANKRAQKLYPDYYITENNLAHAFLMINEFDSAIIYSSKAIKKSKNLANPYAHRGMAFFKKGKPKKALKDLGKAEELNEMYAFTHLYKGLIYEQTNQLVEAKESFKRVFTSTVQPMAMLIASRKLGQLGTKEEEIVGLYLSKNSDKGKGDLEYLLSEMKNYDRNSNYSENYDLFN
ncbi:MAG: hypothetical protein HRT61_11285 [Ekhidna sp.]|nr:hypothetical protein [Ekhidna sp.]